MGEELLLLDEQGSCFLRWNLFLVKIIIEDYYEDSGEDYYEDY